MLGRGDVDDLDQLADLLRSGVAGDIAGGQAGDELGDPLAVTLADLRMQRDHRVGGVLADLAAQPIALGRALGQRGPEIGEVTTAVGDRRDDPRDGRLRLPQPLFQRAARARLVLGAAGALQVVFAHEQRDGVGGEQLRLQPGQDAALELRAFDALRVRAAPRLAVPRATEPRVGDDRHGTAAKPAAQQPRQQVLGAAAQRQRAGGALPARVLRRLPQLVVDDA